MAFKWVLLGICVAVFVMYSCWRTWYLSKPGLRSLLFFRPCRLLSKETLVEAAPGRLAVRRFVFALPPGAADLDIDLALGEHVKIRAPGPLPLSRSYSPVAVRPGELELVVKIYPPDGRGGWKPRAGASAHLDALAEGEAAYISGPYPPPFAHMSRNPGSRVGIVAFGVGITEALGVAWGELRSAREVVLLWALRDRSELYAQAELQALQGAGLKVIYHFSKEAPAASPLEAAGGGGRSAAPGRLGASRLREAFPWDGGAEELRFLVVGTKAMARETYRKLTEAGLQHERLLKKKFGIRPSKRPPANSPATAAKDEETALPGGGAAREAAREAEAKGWRA